MAVVETSTGTTYSGADIQTALDNINLSLNLNHPKESNKDNSEQVNKFDAMHTNYIAGNEGPDQTHESSDDRNPKRDMHKDQSGQFYLLMTNIVVMFVIFDIWKG